MSKINRIKLAKAILKFNSLMTDQGELVYEGELLEGTEVFIEDENGEIVAAPDNEYKAEGKTVVVENGVVTEIREDVIVDEAPAEEAPAEEIAAEEEAPAESDPKDDRIAELEALVAEKDQYIAELEDKIKSLEGEVEEAEAKVEEMSKQSVDNPLNKKLSKTVNTNQKFSAEDIKKNPALKYFIG